VIFEALSPGVVRGARLNVARLRTVFVLLLAAPALADLRVQDVCKLQGQRTNKLSGWGLVVGLDGTGDGAKSPGTLRALAQLHKLYHAPVADIRELAANNNVAIVSVELTIPENGAREGQALDVIVSAVGPSKSLKGGRLLMTPLQDATLSVPNILAHAVGRVDVLDPKNLRSGVVRKGGTLAEDFLYNFIEDGIVTLVLDDAKAGYAWAQVIARTINHELSNPASTGIAEPNGRIVAPSELAIVADAKNVLVKIPEAELSRPAGFISRVLQARLFGAPDQPAVVVINRITNQITFTETVTIAPTVLQLASGTLSIGGGTGSSSTGAAGTAVGLDSTKSAGVGFQELLSTLNKLQLPPDQIVAAVEQLHATGTLHAQLLYKE
jgi:flagellar P-ring protein precursor FlgI